MKHLVMAAALAALASSAFADSDGLALAKKSGCTACHGVSNKIVGPGFNDVAAKYKGNAGAPATLTAKVKSGGSGVWGPVPMPPQAQVKDDDVKTLVSWVLAGAK